MADERPKPKDSPEAPDPRRKLRVVPTPAAHTTLPPQRMADTEEVRAGPGDAGATDSPEKLPPTVRAPRKFDRTSKVILAVGIGVPLILIVIALLTG